MPRSKFVLSKTTHGGYRFDLKARNGETIAQSEPYSAKTVPAAMPVRP